MGEKTNLKLVPLKDGKQWKLLEDYYYEVNGYIIKVPTSFITDLASVPKIFWSIFPPSGKWTPAAVIHDFLYSKFNDTGINRTLADRIFLLIMKELGVGYLKRNTMYKAVRIFGESSWKEKIRNEGYKDIAVVDHTQEALKYYSKWAKILKL
ncbi:hypothetical protein FUSO7_01115 [Fusobacterium necrophorum BFTR-2]|nr:DUF1353 domain-containing protein [Fusobacterium necrophorum]KDE74794.1 hypothetical protein FUSO7_01115 [Fusobacterium necrophorum BFTR-2]